MCQSSSYTAFQCLRSQAFGLPKPFLLVSPNPCPSFPFCCILISIPFSQKQRPRTYSSKGDQGGEGTFPASPSHQRADSVLYLSHLFLTGWRPPSQLPSFANIWQLGSHMLGTSKRHTPPRSLDSGGSVTLTALFSRLWRVGSQGNAWVFSKGEIIPVTNNNICSYSSLDKGN